MASISDYPIICIYSSVFQLYYIQWHAYKDLVIWNFTFWNTWSQTLYVNNQTLYVNSQTLYVALRTFSSHYEE